jgi:hypothetical protein
VKRRERKSRREVLPTEKGEDFMGGEKNECHSQIRLKKS